MPEREIRFRKSFNLAENQIRICGPYEGLGILVALVQIVEHGFLQRSNGSVTSSTNASFGHLGEQSFHQVQPTPAGWREMNVIPRMPRQPTAHFGDFVRAVVVMPRCTSNPRRRLASI